MKRLLVILFLIPGLCFGTYTEFYCNASTGSNLNSGSDEGTSVYTSTNGGWNSGTGVFTPTDGSNPVTATPGVTVGQFASVYIDGATVGVFVGRVTAVTNAVNGTITVSTSAKMGTAPSTNANARTIKVGGVWKGPNAASSFPLSLTGNGSATDASSNPVRINLKNNSSYSITAQVSTQNPVKPTVIQGYSATAGDTGRATIDGSTSTAFILSNATTRFAFIDLIFVTTKTTTIDDLVTDSGEGTFYYRCVFHGARGNGLLLTGIGQVGVELEAYDCNKSNTADFGGFQLGRGSVLVRSYSHDNGGSNGNGFVISDHNVCVNCIADSNAGKNFRIPTFGNSGIIALIGGDAYNATGDGISIASGLTTGFFYAENMNLTKNGGAGINSASVGIPGWTYNFGYGAGTQGNTSGDTLSSIQQLGNVTYPSNSSPYFAPTTGDFRISLISAMGAGRGVFTQTDGTNTGTAGYPDIGSAQHDDTCDNLGPCQTSGASAH